MTEQEQRIAIAEACGWKQTWSEDRQVWDWTRPDGSWCVSANRKEFFPSCLPDYLHDLNASVEFEQVIVYRDLWCQYVEHLRKITGHQDPIDASAAARLQAALRTLNLWKD